MADDIFVSHVGIPLDASKATARSSFLQPTKVIFLKGTLAFA
jgi:hypothetical protein